MQSVALYIMDIVKTIDAAGYEAKGQKGPKSLYEIFLVLLLKNNGANTKAFLNHCKGRKSIKASFIGCKGTKILSKREQK